MSHFASLFDHCPHAHIFSTAHDATLPCRTSHQTPRRRRKSAEQNKGGMMARPMMLARWLLVVAALVVLIVVWGHHTPHRIGPVDHGMEAAFGRDSADESGRVGQ
jgi:hypothetical protein